MNGPQLRKWRLDHDLTLREVAEQLDGLTHTTISRWENSPDSIPTWAADRLLATTQINLPLAELHALLDAARADDLPAQTLIAQAIREWLERRKTTATAATLTPPPQHITRLNEKATCYHA